MVAIIEALITRGLAYRAPDGSVYFSSKIRGCGGVWAAGEPEFD
jgi:cysteinyl-tRNA synthetase